MGVCFLCDAKLFGERTRVCSSITPYSNVPYPEKIVELLGEEFVVIVTTGDHMCKRCTSLLVHMDKLENDLKIVKNAMVSYIQKKHGILPPDQTVKSLEVVNGNLKTDDLEVGQRKVPSGLTTVRENNTVHPPIKMLKTVAPVVDNNASKMKIYKCGFCAFQSKELGHVRFHMRTHMNNRKTELEKATNQSSVAKAITPLPPPQKKRLYRCQVCSKSFDSRVSCLEHIQRDHNASATSTSNEEKEAEVTSSDTTKVGKLVNQNKSIAKQQAESTKTSGEVQEDKNKSVVDTDMLLNDNSQSAEMTIDEPEQPENIEDAEQAEDDAEKETTEEPEEAEETEDAEMQETVEETVQETVIEEQEQEPEPEQEQDQEQDNSAQAEDNSDQEDAMQVDEEIEDSVEKPVDNTVDNKARDLDIESMLAAIHNDNPSTDSGDTQNSV
ncbi:Zinc finger C2H2-type [Cinara cedri]|uniref:Zinc finger C2H2-type n=1 Tax=Cinara cedri TaxID=506608 RepID=A0A5E4MUR1_9HEMI|nr:Zinc finger C2H2-type [Cinara cedri]